MLKFICLVMLVWWSETQPLSEEERARILEVHRKLREEVEPPASNMMLMDYSVELEKLAAKWLVNCTYPLPSVTIHPEYKDIEVALQSGYKPENASFEPASRFHSDKESYKYESNTCTGLCGNYRRIIWAISRQVGCYRHRCEHSDIWIAPRYVMACLYKPAGRNLYGLPYISGSSCSRCPQGLGCYRKQCTEKKTLGVVGVPLDESVVRESAATKKQIIQTQTTTSSTKKPLIQTQKTFSPTMKPFIKTQTTFSTIKKPSVEVQPLTTRTKGTSGLIQTSSGEASRSQPTTSFSTHLSTFCALMFAIVAMIFLS